MNSVKSSVSKEQSLTWLVTSSFTYKGSVAILAQCLFISLEVAELTRNSLLQFLHQTPEDY